MQPINSGISKGLTSHPASRSQANAPQSKLNFGQAKDVALFHHHHKSRPNFGTGDITPPLHHGKKQAYPSAHLD